MNKASKTGKRVIRPLTAEEATRLAAARREVEAEREEILREARIEKQATDKLP